MDFYEAASLQLRIFFRDIGKTGRIHARIVSSDMLRKVITPKPTYSEEERDTVYAAIVFVALLLTKNNVNVTIDATGNRQRYRD